MNFGSMLKQAQQVQKRLQDAQKDLAETEVSGAAGNGNVEVVCDGHGKFKRIKISKEAVNPENPSAVDDETIEMLQDLITSAMQQAISKSNVLMQNKMKGIVPAGINIPGLF